MSDSTSIALVTGGNRGIGLAIASALKAAGHRVVITYRSGTPPTGFEAVQMDVTDAESVDAAFAKIEAEIGQPEIIVANAGITKDGLFMWMTPEDWSKVINTSLNGFFNVTNFFIQKMLRNKYGRIVNMVSVSGVKGTPGQTNYSAAKAGMHGFSMALAQELATKGVTVNRRSPGYIGTDMVKAIRPDVLEKIVATVPVKRLGEPSEIASIIAWLASEEGGYATGADFSVNGGLHMG